MIKYKRLSLIGKITSPEVTSSYVEVRGGGDVMYEQDRVLKLTISSKLNSNAEDWNSFITDNRGSLRSPIEKNK